jgi:diguanylate cyclase (GGDEF)-like protein
MPGSKSSITMVRDWPPRLTQSRFVRRVRSVRPIRRRIWLLNVTVFLALTVPTLAIGTAAWPLRIAATAGLIGACVWEGVALRVGHFPLWADVLDTAAIALVAWRYPVGTGGLMFVLAFAILALAYRTIYSTTTQAAARTVSVLAALLVGAIDDHPGHLRRLPVVVLVIVVVAFQSAWVTRLFRERALLTRRRQVAHQLAADLAAATGRHDVHAAMLNGVLELLHGRNDARVIIWDEADMGRPTAAAGVDADKVPSGVAEPMPVAPWVRDAMEAGQSTYRESIDDIEQVRSALSFEPITRAVFVVPLRHREQLRALSVSAREPISPDTREGIEYVAKLGEAVLGSIELTRGGLEGLRERDYHDPRTQLASRDLLSQRLERALEEPDSVAAVIMVRINRFRELNDSLGPAAGGDALVTLTARLHDAVPPHSTVARYGSDEFAVLLERLAGPEAVEQIARRMLSGLDEPLEAPLGTGRGVTVRGDIGAALSGPNARTASDLLRNADVALREAGTSAARSYRIFDPGMRASLVEELALESDLRRALDNDEFELHYQPTVQLAAWDRVSGVEALIRWNRAGHGLVPPGQFIPAAEDTGLINQIGAWVLRESCHQQRDWAATHSELSPLAISVNLSPVQLADPDIAHMVGDLVRESGADPERIIIEITEGALVENTAANLDKLKAIKSYGLRLALDDFGTGFSSLSYLRQFPFDIIKIDRSFVREVDVDEDAASLAKSVIGIAKALKLTTLAEGVETFGQADWLTRAGCDAAQGYFFARPTPPAELLPTLTNGLPLPPGPPLG